MFIAGRQTWRISLDEPQVLRTALYIRDVAGLHPASDPAIPPLDPPPTVWPVWAGNRPAPPDLPPLSEADRRAAEAQWIRWWDHLLARGFTAEDELQPPTFKAFAHLPELRWLLTRYHPSALAWCEAMESDPRVKRDHQASGTRLTDLVAECERDLGRPALPFELRISILAVETKHAWVLSPSHFLMTHHLIRDDENALDWLRPRIRALS